jgi:hypothetical protein
MTFLRTFELSALVFHHSSDFNGAALALVGDAGHPASIGNRGLIWVYVMSPRDQCVVDGARGLVGRTQILNMTVGADCPNVPDGIGGYRHLTQRLPAIRLLHRRSGGLVQRIPPLKAYGYMAEDARRER